MQGLTRRNFRPQRTSEASSGSKAPHPLDPPLPSILAQTLESRKRSPREAKLRCGEGLVSQEPRSGELPAGTGTCGAGQQEVHDHRVGALGVHVDLIREGVPDHHRHPLADGVEAQRVQELEGEPAQVGQLH